MTDSDKVELRFVDSSVRWRSAVNTTLPLRVVGGSAQAVRDICRVYRQLKVHRPDVVHLCTSAGPAALKDLVLLRLAKRFHVPSIIHYHVGRLPGVIARGGAEWGLIRRAMSLASTLVLLDRNSMMAVRTQILGVPSICLPNMIELDAVDNICRESQFKADHDTTLRVTFVGHVIPMKGVRELVAACAELGGRFLSLQLVGPCNPVFSRELQAISRSTGDARWLKILGPQAHEDAIRHIAQADVVALPSYTEGMPFVLLEAMACNRAILSTAVGAVPEMLDVGGPGECGVCVPPRDTHALVTALVRLKESPRLRLTMGKKARLRAETVYSMPIGCRRLMDLWQFVNWDQRPSAIDAKG